jgi:hypothetical protein
MVPLPRWGGGGGISSLAHRVGDLTELSYRRGDALDKRRDLMDAWAAFLEGTDSNVVPLSRRVLG